ncbi:MAG: 3-methyl-2-oxobutanoate dehydrogenase subunit beta, partial [Clostridia bacterium]|nr:3-methyl-2-oxobutanoate dehydrogenase subunit beta [Clostridia bacterium]
HGDYHLIVLAPASVQEMADLTVKAFDLSDKYRVPAMLLADGTMGQMMEPVSLEMGEVESYDKSWCACGGSGERPRNIVNSLFLKAEELEYFNIKRYEKYAEIEKNEAMYEEYMMDDAEICIAAFGIAARVSKNAIDEARKMGIKVGMIRPITLWPFPKAAFNAAADKVKAFVSVELSMGQLIEDVELATRCKKPVLLCNRSGGMIPTLEDVLNKIKEAGGIN